MDDPISTWRVTRTWEVQAERVTDAIEISRDLPPNSIDAHRVSYCVKCGHVAPDHFPNCPDARRKVPVDYVDIRGWVDSSSIANRCEWTDEYGNQCLRTNGHRFTRHLCEQSSNEERGNSK